MSRGREGAAKGLSPGILRVQLGFLAVSLWRGRMDRGATLYGEAEGPSLETFTFAAVPAVYTGKRPNAPHTHPAKHCVRSANTEVAILQCILITATVWFHTSLPESAPRKRDAGDVART